MTIPLASNFPDSFDTNTNLYEVHDSLRLILAEDYNPGDTTISWVGDLRVASLFPANGIITLTEQCSDVDRRAISFHYTNIDFTTNTFGGLELLPEFIDDTTKPKRLTHITLNVVDRHHNTIKEAIIAIEEFVGVKGTIDSQPFGETMEGRINFLRRLVLVPRAWFTVNKRIGLVPLEVEFTDLSFRLATDGETGPITYVWDFGDNTSSSISMISSIEVTDVVPDVDNVVVTDLDGGSVIKTYHSPGTYDVTLTVSNNFGSNTITMPAIVNARLESPDEAVINFLPNSEQNITTTGTPVGGPFVVTPVIRTPVETLINIEVPQGRNTNIVDEDVSFAGELLDAEGNAIDPIIEYTWSFADDLPHSNSNEATASYSLGGLYDMKLRVDTESGSYRITTYEDAIDVVEKTNLWYWVYTSSTSNIVRAYEFGLLNETFKVGSVNTLSLNSNDSFLDSVPEEETQKREFRKNVFFAPRGSVFSGTGGSGFLFWASGRDEGDARSTEKIYSREFKGFELGGISEYAVRPDITSQPWNWAGINFDDSSYFLFGNHLTEPAPFTSPVHNNVTSYNLLTQTINSNSFDETADFANGAQEILQNIAQYDSGGDPTYGEFTVYRTASKDDTGYILRNDTVGPFFKLKSFYRTEGIAGDPVQSVRKLADIGGPTKVEGELTDLQLGIYFFNNSGSIAVYGDQVGTWTTSGPGINSVSFRSLQDTTQNGFDDPENTLLVASDGDRRAYITFDYSPNVFLKFNEIDQTFTTLGARPTGSQWLMSVY